MAKHQRNADNNITCVFKIFSFLIILTVSQLSFRSISCNGHLIHIDHQEFRASGFPRPHLPPPLSTFDELSHITAKELTPSEFMVDLTNDLAYRILHYHSILNRNNFAFSPTALMSVLVAIFEGSTGRSATELKNVLQLPNNPDVIRVGYRDIHRRLRTYFFGSDNPLKGLSLNKDNVTITRDYETILMFYGYDLGIDMISSTVMPTSTTTTEPTTSMATTVEVEENTTTPLDTTKKDIATTTETANIETTTTTTMTPITTISTSPIGEITTTESTTTTTQEPTTEVVASTTSEETSTIKPEETTPELSSTTTDETSTEAITTETTNSETETNEAAELISSFVAEENSEPLSRIQKARVTRLPSAKLQAPLTSNTKPQANYLPSQRKSKRLTTSRNKRHLFGFKELDSNLFINLFQTESHLHNPLPALSAVPSYVQVSNDYEVETDPNFIVTSQTSADLKQNYNTDVISHVFYLNNQQLIYTTFKVYNAVLYYKYFEHLRMSVLELELDTPEYNLIIMLPDYNTDLVSAASSLRAGPKLRLIRKQLKPKWVQAIIPDFKLHGTMFLTNDLQNLGVCDIFEPNRADFRPMTDEKSIYVKHIEQSINIHIRTNPINQLRRNNGAQAQPIQISVNHPFMFFIIDRDLDVAVMTGRILNPLNVRIQ